MTGFGSEEKAYEMETIEEESTLSKYIVNLSGEGWGDWIEAENVRRKVIQLIELIETKDYEDDADIIQIIEDVFGKELTPKVTQTCSKTSEVGK